MCIYLGNGDTLTYNGEEHIIPAGIGGMRKLPKGVVSDQFNNGISKLEQRFLRDSIVVAMPRMFLGPGKRGSLSDSKATKSKIQLVKNPEAEVPFGLGYTQLGKTREIPTLLVNTTDGRSSFGFDKSEHTDPLAVITDYKSKCQADSWLRIRIEENNELPVDTILIGVKEGIEENYNCFVFRHPENTLEINKERIKAIGNGINFDNKEPQAAKYMPHVQGKGDFDIEYYRLFGKMAFNTLAMIKGADFVNAAHFDKVREWIAVGGEYNFASMLQGNALQHLGLNIPKDAHYVLITRNGQIVIANVTLYNSFTVQVLLSDSFSGQLSLDGFICDWPNKKEYLWYEYLKNTLKPDPIGFD